MSPATKPQALPPVAGSTLARHRKEALLVLISCVCAFSVVEAALRLFGPPQQTVTLEQAGTKADKPLEPSEARRYVDAMPVAPGVDRAWFLQTPPPLANRAAPRPAAVARYHEYEKLGLFAPQSEYVWNSDYVEVERCRSDGRLRGFPPPVDTFSPGDLTIYPRYRFAAGVTTVAGLVTNQFGLRGHPVELQKPARTIRIAFLGASTTAGFHYFAYSYPEYLEHFLNLWAQANHLDVRFEALNGGREAIGAAEEAVILERELLPLDPDLAIVYPSANDFVLDPNRFLNPPIERRSDLDPSDTAVPSRLPGFLLRHLASARLIELVWNGFQTVGEPRKPAYKILWPASVNEADPDPGNPDMPAGVPDVVRGLESSRRSMEKAGGKLIVCSVKWLPGGFALSAQRHQAIYRPYNTVMWPLRYRDILRLADFQNRVLHKYAQMHHAEYVDVAGKIPDDVNLFLDSLHLTETGIRLQAWVMMQQLVPVLRADIEAGRLPRAAGSHALPRPPSMATFPMDLTCGPPAGTGPAASEEIPLSALRVEPNGKLQAGPPMRLTAAPPMWAEIAAARFHMPSDTKRVLYVRAHGRVLKGRIGIGWINQNGDSEGEIFVPESAEMRDIFLPVAAPSRASGIRFRNTADGVASEIVVDSLSLTSAR